VPRVTAAARPTPGPASKVPAAPAAKAVPVGGSEKASVSFRYSGSAAMPPRTPSSSNSSIIDGTSR